MNAGSPKVRAAWRGLALLFAVSVVTIRLGVAGCGPAFIGPTKAGGGFNAERRQVATEPAPAGGAVGKAGAPGAKDASASPAADNVTPPRLFDPAFMPPTKAGGGFFPGPLPAGEPQKQARPSQAPSKPRNDPAAAAPQVAGPR